MEQKYPRHQQLSFGALLAAIAGSLDAYTYLQHGEVFAGLQTGNCILLGVQISLGHYAMIPRYIVAILAFLIGAIIIKFVQYRFELSDNRVQHEIFVLGYEFCLLVLVSVISPFIPDMYSTALLSVIAAGQLQEFRVLKGGPFTSLMMTGNLRTLGDSLFTGFVAKDANAREKSGDIATIIVSFIAGAIVMGLITPIFKDYAIGVTAVVVAIAWLRLFVHRNAALTSSDAHR